MFEIFYLLCCIPALLFYESRMSLVYLLFIFNIPLVKYLWQRRFKVYLFFYLVLLLLLSSGLFGVHIYLFISNTRNTDSADFSSPLQKTLYFIGPGLACLSNVFGLYLLLQQLFNDQHTKYQLPSRLCSESILSNLSNSARRNNDIKTMLFKNGLCDTFTLILTGLSAVSYPSIFGVMYLMVFFGRCFVWRSRKSFKHEIKNSLLFLLCILIAIHICLIFVTKGLIQTDSSDRVVWVLRILGLSLSTRPEDNFRSLSYWTRFVYPVVSYIVMYFTYCNHLVNMMRVKTRSVSHKGLNVHHTAAQEEESITEKVPESLEISEEDGKKWTNMKYYLFGYLSSWSFELCTICTTILTTFIHANIFSFVYILIMSLYSICRRMNKKLFSTLYMTILILLFASQYFLYIFRKELLFQAGNTFFATAVLTTDSLIFIADILQMVAVSYHYQVRKYKTVVENIEPNEAVEMKIGQDYMNHQSKAVDYLKYFTFAWFHWVSLSFIFITGLINFNFMGVLYLMFSFIFFVNYSKIVTKHKKWLKTWNLMWLVTLGFILVKIFPKVFHVYIGQERLSCETLCSDPIFDVICLSLITLQIKIFKNKAFCYVVLHLHIQRSFETRGSQIVHSQLIKRIRHLEELENKVKDKLIQKMEKIKIIQSRCNYPPVYNMGIILRSVNYYGHQLDPKDDEENLMDILSNYSTYQDQTIGFCDTNKANCCSKDAERQEISIINIDPQQPKTHLSPLSDPSIQTGILHRIKQSLICLSILIDRITEEHRRVLKILDYTKQEEKTLILKDIKKKNTNLLSYDFNQRNVPDDFSIISSKTINIWDSTPKRPWSILKSILNFLLVKSDYVCYFWIILNCGLASNVLMVLFPFIVLLWAIHSVPRPSKKLWIILKYYTMITIIVNFICQWNVIQMNEQLQMILGFTKSNHYAVLDGIQLLLIFLNCEYLKYTCQWGKHRHSEVIVDGENQSTTRTMLKSKLYKMWNKMGLPKNKLRTNVYTYTFVCELISTVIILADYKSFVPVYTSSHIFNFLTEKVSHPLLGMMVAQFFVIIFDRILLLRRSVRGKFFFQIVYIFVIHLWLTICLQKITNKTLRNLIGPIFLYFFKYIYFVLSAFEIKYGYPVVRTRNFLTWQYNWFCYIAYSIYMKIPFLHHFRMCIDWIFTDSALGLSHWNYVESVFTDIYNISFWRNVDEHNNCQRGIRYGLGYKALIGVLIIMGIVGIIWAPPISKAIIDSNLQSSPVDLCELSLSIGDFKPIFFYSSKGQSLINVPKTTIDKLPSCFPNDLESINYLENFQHMDVKQINITKFLTEYWNPSKDVTEKLGPLINDPEYKINFQFQIKCQKPLTNTQSKEIVYKNRIYLTTEERSSLYNVIFGQNKTGIPLRNLIPRFLTAYKSSLVHTEIFRQEFQHVILKYVQKLDSSDKIWQVEEVKHTKGFCAPEFDNDDKDGVWSIFIFNERISTSRIGRFINDHDIPILRLYMLYMFVISGVIVTYFGRQHLNIYHQEMSQPFRIHTILNDIYLAREYKLYDFEELSVAKLFYIYQSQENLLRWTKEKRRNLEKFSIKIE